MKAVWLADQRTVLTAPEVLRAIARVLTDVEGREPAPITVAIHGAQSAGESGRWKSCHWFNLDNTKAGLTWEGHYTCYKCNEQVAPKDWRFFLPEGELVGGFGTALRHPPLPVPDGHPQTRFRAFQSLEEGAREHVLFEKRRYPEAYQAASYGDVRGFVLGLKSRGFFTADFEPYYKMVASITREYLPLAAESHRDTVPAPTTTEQEECEAMACVAPDPERALHSEAVVAMMLGQEGMWDALAEEKKRNLQGD